jgi:glycosyltransferase involved in cell wall biosynthesis
MSKTPPNNGSEKIILIDLLNLATSQIAGVGVFTRNLLKLWLKDNALHYSVVCYSSTNIDAAKVFGFTTNKNITVKYIKAKHVLVRFLYQQLLLPFKLRKFHLYFNPTLGLPFAAKIIAPRTKLLVTIHDMIPFFFPKKYSKSRGLIVKIVSVLAAKAAHMVLTVSKNSKKDIVDIAHINEAKVKIVYNFISKDHEIDNRQDNNFFLCVSTLEPGKNVENAIKGFSIFVKKTNYAFKFYWIGRIGWVYTEKYLLDLIKSENLEGSFVLLGYITEEKKEEYIRHCTAIVYLSHYEGFGLPVLEGMIYNKVILASNNSSLPEAVGNAGVLCDPADANSIANGMQEIIVKREALMLNIEAHLKQFDPQTQLKTFTNIIDSML